MLFAGTVRTSAKLWQKEFRPLKSLVERMNCLMIAAGFPVFTDRFNQVLNYPAPVRARFPDFITHKSAFNTDTPYGRRCEIDAVFIEDATQFLQDIPRGLAQWTNPGRLGRVSRWNRLQNRS
jgi:hypothetical protein